jgi:hypothetical protein
VPVPVEPVLVCGAVDCVCGVLPAAGVVPVFVFGAFAQSGMM